MIEASKLDGKTLVCLKPCDTYSFNQLIKEHRVDREKAYIIGVGCRGKLDIEKIRETGIKGITDIKGAQIENEADTLTVETLYGEKTFRQALQRIHLLSSFWKNTNLSSGLIASIISTSEKRSASLV